MLIVPAYGGGGRGLKNDTLSICKLKKKTLLMTAAM